MLLGAFPGGLLGQQFHSLSFVLSREAEGAAQGLGALQAVGSRDWKQGLETGTGMCLPSVLTDLTCALQCLKLVRTQPSTAEIESILDSDQRDLIGDFSKVMPEIPWPSAGWNV